MTTTKAAQNHIAKIEAGKVYYGHNKTTLPSGYFLTIAGNFKTWYIRSEETQRIVARLKLVAYVD